MAIADGRKVAIRFTQPLIGKLNETLDFPQDLNEWSFNNPNASFSNECVNGLNSISYVGGGNFERFYIKLDVERNSAYRFSFYLCSPSGFSYGGYGAMFDYAFVSLVDPSNVASAAEGIDKLARTRDYDTSASETPALYDMMFDSGDNDSVYIAIDLGYITDGTQIILNISDISLEKLTNIGHITATFDEYNYVPDGSLSKVIRYPTDIEMVDDCTIVLIFASGNVNSIQRAVGDITIAYDGAGSLKGQGGPVLAFEQKFTPEGLDPKNDPHNPEHLELVDIATNTSLSRVYYTNTNNDEHVELYDITVTHSLLHIDDI